jgi:hypothetical protein
MLVGAKAADAPLAAADRNTSPWIAPTLENSWTQYSDTAFNTVGWHIDGNATLHLRGLVSNAGTTGWSLAGKRIFQFAGGIPTPLNGMSNHRAMWSGQTTAGTTTVLITVRTTGVWVQINTASPPVCTWLSLDGISVPLNVGVLAKSIGNHKANEHFSPQAFAAWQDLSGGSYLGANYEVDPFDQWDDWGGGGWSTGFVFVNGPVTIAAGSQVGGGFLGPPTYRHIYGAPKDMDTGGGDPLGGELVRIDVTDSTVGTTLFPVAVSMNIASPIRFALWYPVQKNLLVLPPPPFGDRVATELPFDDNTYRGRSPFVALTFANSWASYGGGYAPGGYYLDNAVSNRVHLNGLVAGGTLGATIGTAPAPTKTHVFMTMGVNGPTEVRVNASGQISTGFNGGNTWVSLSGIQYSTS